MARKMGKMSTVQAMDIIDTHVRAAVALRGLDIKDDQKEEWAALRESIIEEAWNGYIEGIGPVTNGEGTILGEALRAIY